MKKSSSVKKQNICVFCALHSAGLKAELVEPSNEPNCGLKGDRQTPSWPFWEADESVSAAKTGLLE